VFTAVFEAAEIISILEDGSVFEIYTVGVVTSHHLQKFIGLTFT